MDGVTWDSGGVRAGRIFRELTPKDQIGGSAFLVYEGTFDLSPIIAMQHLARIGADVHEPLAVLEEAKIAAGSILKTLLPIFACARHISTWGKGMTPNQHVTPY